MNALHESQIEALANYQAITETWDTEQAVEVLQKHDWDVSKASIEFFSTDNTTNVIGNLVQQVPQVELPRPVNDSWGKKIKNIVSGLWKTIIPEEIRGENSSAAEVFITRLQETRPLGIVFNTLQFQELLSVAYEQRKLIFVYLHAFNDEYPREVFNDIRLVRALEKEFICWGVDSDSSEGLMIKRQLNIEVFPCVVLVRVLDPKKPIVLEKNSGYLDSHDLLGLIEKYLSRASVELLQERRLRETQEEELKEAERITLLKAKEKCEKEAKEKRDCEKKETLKAERKNEILARVGNEPDPADDVAQVSFKLPSGKRIERRFFKHMPVQVLYDYLESLDIFASELATGFPSITLSNYTNTLEAEGVFPKSVIHVREANN